MGLNAVVFRSVSRLPDRLKAAVRHVDPRTGQPEFDTIVGRVSSQEVEALSVHFGNLSEISHIRTLVTESGCACPMLLGRVFYSGSHSGDVIGRDDVLLLAQELACVHEKVDAELQSTLSKVSQLVEQSVEHENPIVFM